MSGLEACRQIKIQHPHLPILALTSRSEPTLINRLIATGIQGFYLKGIDAQTLALAIRSVVAGASWWDSNATNEIRTTFTQSPDKSLTPNLSLLTEREQEILALMATGNTDQEIGDRLYIALGTAWVYIHAIVNKLGVRDRAQAVALLNKSN